MNKTTIDSPSDYMKMFALLAEARASLRETQDVPTTFEHWAAVKQTDLKDLSNFPGLEAHLFSLLALD